MVILWANQFFSRRIFQFWSLTNVGVDFVRSTTIHFPCLTFVLHVKKVFIPKCILWVLY